MPTASSTFLSALDTLLQQEARPVEKYGHQPRLYALTQAVGSGCVYDDDVVCAAAYLHDLGVFSGHRPEDPVLLARWDHVAYAVEKVPALLAAIDFPAEKVPAVLDAIRTHQPQDTPQTIEAIILRDADILEQLGAVGILRSVAKVGRDTRYHTFTPVVDVLRRSLDRLPAAIQLDTTRELAAPRIATLQMFLHAVEEETQGQLF